MLSRPEGKNEVFVGLSIVGSLSQTPNTSRYFVRNMKNMEDLVLSREVEVKLMHSVESWF